MSLEELGIMDCVAGLCFDTNTVLPKGDNDGGISDACTIIEQRLGRDLHFLACHHVTIIWQSQWFGRHSKGQVVHLLAVKFFYISDVGGMTFSFAGATHHALCQMDDQGYTCMRLKSGSFVTSSK